MLLLFQSISDVMISRGINNAPKNAHLEWTETTPEKKTPGCDEISRIFALRKQICRINLKPDNLVPRKKIVPDSSQLVRNPVGVPLRRIVRVGFRRHLGLHVGDFCFQVSDPGQRIPACFLELFDSVVAINKLLLQNLDVRFGREGAGGRVKSKTWMKMDLSRGEREVLMETTKNQHQVLQER